MATINFPRLGAPSIHESLTAPSREDETPDQAMLRDQLADVYSNCSREAIAAAVLAPSAGLLACARAGPSSVTPQKSRLDSLLNEAWATYRLRDGSGNPIFDEYGRAVSVRVMPHFRMPRNSIPGAKAQELMVSTLRKANAWPSDAAQSQRLSTAISHCAFGLATPAEVVSVTQRLIDIGCLPSGTTPEQRVRSLMWDYGIGIDCAAYTAQAVARAAGTTPEALGIEVLTKGSMLIIAGNPAFRAVPFLSATAGDVIQLDDRTGPIGHNVTVAERHLLSANELGALERNSEDWVGFLRTGPIHSFSVDSAWGAHGQRSSVGGGVGRRVWLYNEASAQWAELGGHPQRISVTDGPYDHILVGTYRPR